MTKERVVYYHKPNPDASCSDGGSAGNQPGSPSYTINQVSLDQVSVDVLLTGPADVCVQIGANPETTLQAKNGGASHFAVPFNGQTGPVTVTLKRNGQAFAVAKGSTISTACSEGLVNYNAIVEGSP